MSSAAWLASPLLRWYAGRFFLLWVLAKGVLIAGAVKAQTPLLVFRPTAESLACAVELLVLGLFLRRRGEDVLLANLRLSLGTALAPLVVLHAALSGAVAAAGRWVVTW